MERFWQALAWMDRHLTPDWLSAIGTIAAVVLALFVLWFERHWLRPRLKLELVFGPPDCHAIKDYLKNPDGQIGIFDAHWFRLRVRNVGRSAATQVEVIVQDVNRLEGGEWKPLSTFLPSSLVWTHLGAPAGPYLSILLPGTYKNCDVARVTDPSARRFSSEVQDDGTIPPDAPALQFEITVHPTRPYHIVPPGQYRVVVTAAAQNAEATRVTLEISLSETWSSDEALFQKERIRMRLVGAGRSVTA